MTFESQSARTAAGDDVACKLGAADLSRQGERWRRLIARAAVARLDTPDGLRIRFRADAAVAEELRRLIAIENACCSWADWSVDAGGDHVVLHITSTGDGVAAIQSMFTES